MLLVFHCFSNEAMDSSCHSVIVLGVCLLLASSQNRLQVPYVFTIVIKFGTLLVKKKMVMLLGGAGLQIGVTVFRKDLARGRVVFSFI